MRITNEVLYTEIKNIKKDTEAIKKNDIAQWKIINKNAQDIASQKSVIKIIEGFVGAIIISIIGFVWGKYR